MHQSHDRIVFRKRLRRSARIINRCLSALRMHIDDTQITRVGPGIQSLKNEFLAAWKVGQSKILRRRADENEVILLRIVQSEKAAPLYLNGMIQQAEDLVQFMHRQHFADSGVVVQDQVAGVARRVHVAHSGFRTPHERRIAENYPGSLRSWGERTPEPAKSRR